MNIKFESPVLGPIGLFANTNISSPTPVPSHSGLAHNKFRPGLVRLNFVKDAMAFFNVMSIFFAFYDSLLSIFILLGAVHKLHQILEFFDPFSPHPGWQLYIIDFMIFI